MPRPRVDTQEIQNRIVEIAETLLIETSGQRLVLSDIAARMGVSQPYIYQHFKNKDALVAELASRWFAKVESAGQDICASDLLWQEKLRSHILTTLELKKGAYDANPELFKSYLQLAASHIEIIQSHADILKGQVRSILDQQLEQRDLDETVDLVLDATVLFRVPAAIVAMPDQATADRAERVLDALISFLETGTARS